MNLMTNRYGVVTSTAIQPSGITVSTPIYISLPVEQRKAVLNSIRQIKTQQLMEMGWKLADQKGGYRFGTDESFEAPPLTPVETELGCTEDHLRAALFSRHGMTERLLVKIQNLTGISVVHREQIEATYKDWLNHLFT